MRVSNQGVEALAQISALVQGPVRIELAAAAGGSAVQACACGHLGHGCVGLGRGGVDHAKFGQQNFVNALGGVAAGQVFFGPQAAVEEVIGADPVPQGGLSAATGGLPASCGGLSWRMANQVPKSPGQVTGARWAGVGGRAVNSLADRLGSACLLWNADAPHGWRNVPNCLGSVKLISAVWMTSGGSSASVGVMLRMA